jgi:hypothetical protein
MLEICKLKYLFLTLDSHHSSRIPADKRSAECTRCGQLFLCQPDLSGALEHLEKEHNVTEGDEDARAELLVFSCRGCRDRSDSLAQLEEHVGTCDVKN